MAKEPRRVKEQRKKDEELAELAREAVEAFRKEQPEAHEELVRAFDGRSADLALLGGNGRFHVEVRDGEVVVDPEAIGKGRLTARGAASPETLMAIMEGRLTPLEAFFKGDVIARAKSADLHIAYGYFVKFADAALTSEGLQKVRERFSRTYPTEPQYEDWADLA
jgi:hypothetical protein